MKKAFWIYLALTLCIMGVIYYFSAQTGEISSNVSLSVTKKVVTEEKTSDLSGQDAKKKIDSAEAIIRKTAHFLVYTVLGFCVFMTMYYSGKMNKKYILFTISIVFCIIYASSDEIHQLFVCERSGELRDVLIDSSGAFIGSLCAFCMSKIKCK